MTQPPRPQSFWSTTAGSLLIVAFALAGLAALWLLARIALALD